MKTRVPLYLLLCFITVFFAYDAYADDSVYSGDGIDVYPLQSTDIQMVAEVITVSDKGGRDRFDVDVDMTFKNHGAKTTVQMGFPILADEVEGERVELDPHFRTWVNGNEVSITKKHGIPHPVKDYPHFSDAVYTYPITFSQDETVRIKHHYAVGGTFDSMGGWNFTYILRTGALWKGTIENFKLIYKTQASTVHEIYNTEPKEQVREHHGQEIHLVWNFTNYKPQNDFKVFGNFKRTAPAVENVPSPDKVSEMLIEYYKDKKYEGDKRLYTASDILYNLNAADRDPLKDDNIIRLYAKALRNEIYARHGRVFSTSEMKKIFESAPWYKPNSDFKESELNDIEKKNVDLISAFEKKNGSK